MKRKRIAALLLACGMLTGSLAGCGGGDSKDETLAESGAAGGGSGEVLTLMHYFDPNNPEDPYSVGFMALIDQFEKDTGIQIKLETVPWNEIESKLVMTNQSGNPTCDLSWVSSQKLSSLVNAGTLLPLDDYYARLDTSGFIQQALDAATYAGDDKKYLVEMSVHSRGLWYNTDLVPEPPKTWDELVEIGQKVNDPANGVYAFAAYTPKSYDTAELYLAPFTWSAGGKLGNEDGTAAWDNEGARKALQFASDLKNKYGLMGDSCFVSDQSELRHNFLNGNVAMLLENTAQLAEINQSELGKAGKIKFAPIPGETGPAPCFTNGWSAAIPSHSKHPDLAWKFIEYMVQPEVQIAHSKFDGGLPILSECYEDEYFKSAQYPDIADNLAKNAGTMDPFVYYQEALESFSTVNMSYMMDPSQDLEAMLQSSAKEFNTKYYGS